MHTDNTVCHICYFQPVKCFFGITSYLQENTLYYEVPLHKSSYVFKESVRYFVRLYPVDTLYQ